MLKLRKLAYVLLALILVVGFIGCGDDDDDNGNGGVTPPSTGITIFWDNQANFTVDFYLDGIMVHRVLSGGSASTTGVSMGTHMLHACIQDYKPPQAGCEGEEVNLTGDFTYTIY